MSITGIRQEERREEVSEETGDSARPVVMVVDDNEELRALLRAWLERRGCRVVETGDGRGASAVAARERPDLVLVDLHMPEVDGFSAEEQRLFREKGFDPPKRCKECRRAKKERRAAAGGKGGKR